MIAASTDVVIVGGGIAGIATAYFLGLAGVETTVVEQDAVGSHASGFAYGGLGSLKDAPRPGPTGPIAHQGLKLHKELAESLPAETGINTEYRQRLSLSLAFTEREVEEASNNLLKKQQKTNPIRWLDGNEARSIEPRISHEVRGAVYTEGTSDLEPYRLALALAQAAENLGATIRHGRVTGLESEHGRVHGVKLENGKISCDRVVLAMGPWSGLTSGWLGVPIEVRPLKGQILRLRAPGPPFQCSLGWAAGNYATTKPDGLLWVGTTEEEVGFDERPTVKARDEIMSSLLRVVPSLANAQLVHHTACLRPMSADRLLLLGKVPGWEGLYMGTGGGRQGIELGPAIGHIIAELITRGVSSIPIDAFDPGRFAK